MPRKPRAPRRVIDPVGRIVDPINRIGETIARDLSRARDMDGHAFRGRNTIVASIPPVTVARIFGDFRARQFYSPLT
jgi:hypothetical protein